MSRGWWAGVAAKVGRMAEAERRAQLAAHLKRGRKRSTFRYAPPQWQQDVVKALGENDEHRAKQVLLHEVDA